MKKAIFIALVATLLLTAAILVVTFNVRSGALAQVDRELSTHARVIADSMDHQLQARMLETFTFAALPSIRGFAASDEEARPSRAAVAQSELRSIVASDPAFGAASIVDTNGHVILTTDDSMNADWSERVFVQEGLVGHLYASVPARDFDQVLQYYSAPILNNYGNVAGVLVLRVTAQELWDTFRSIENVLVVDENGVRIADSNTAPQLFTAIAPLSSDLMTRVVAEKRYGAQTAEIRVVPFPALANRIGSTRAWDSFSANGPASRVAIRRLETNPWSVVVMVREDAALAPADATFWQAFGLGVTAALTVSWLVYVVRRGIKR